MTDLFSNNIKNEYNSEDIEVLEGLEPVRKRPGMYIGGTDEHAFHHLVTEVLDNSIDEAVAGHATLISIELKEDNRVKIIDNGRGIPVAIHPKFPTKSALEVIMTTLHSGGKFSNKSYTTSGGLHGVGISVVNALSSELVVEVVREKTIWSQTYKKGLPISKLEKIGKASNRRGTSIEFKPDKDIFVPGINFQPDILMNMAKTKAYLTKGVEVHWYCSDTKALQNDCIEKKTFLYPNGIADYLLDETREKNLLTSIPFIGKIEVDGNTVEWAITWLSNNEQGFIKSHCNTVQTILGGNHESGVKQAILKGIREWGELSGNKKAFDLTIEDILPDTAIILSLFLKEPEFQGQTKQKLVNNDVAKLVTNAIKDPFDYWLSSDPSRSNDLLELAINRSEDRKRKKKEKEIARKTATRKFRLPGKLADCISSVKDDTELFIVEGDSAGGSAKQARERQTQAILPLRGKILNVASATQDKQNNNQELTDLKLALGYKTKENNSEVCEIRYGKIIIMTDADVDGAHIAALLMTYFYKEMPDLIENGHLFLAQPPLYRLTLGAHTEYASDDENKDFLIKSKFKNSKNVEVSRFKGLGEMPPKQLRETTMSKSKRKLIKVELPKRDVDEADQRRSVDNLVDALMGKKAELRFDYIRNNAPKLLDPLDI